MSPFFASNGLGSTKFGKVCPNEAAEAKRSGVKIREPVYSESSVAPPKGESAHRRINEEVFLSKDSPLENIFGIKHLQVARYFDQECDTEKVARMKI